MNFLEANQINVKIRFDFDTLATIHEDSHVIISKNCQEEKRRKKKIIR